ncbi:GNAT family N-acetyltransferase [Candidatus Desulfosporosinus nitrosoreducens]|uniref:GNAT family N-acetyltransferase n=1 Tax=Candidatus Desulfosporosinus nitrosoreducens TaxID=3401928 RepID=UPI00280B0C34|nr:GNAT family N-acetyltransferase [Desulfosporosinus sp. PR]
MTTLEHITLGDMVEIWNRCWQGYYYDMVYTQEHMKFWLDLGQVVLADSVAIYTQNQIVGFSLLAISGDEGWIAGTCIAPDYRGRGFFTPLMRSQLDLAARLGLKRIYLEVLTQNYAQKVYLSVGFKRIRQLQIFRTGSEIKFPPGLAKVSSCEQVSLSQYFAKRKLTSFNPAWQRRQSYLERYGNLTALINSEGTAGILLSPKKNAPLLDIWSSTAIGAEEIISTAFHLRSQGFSLINQPEDWIVAVLRANGMRPNAQQYEMCFKLA